MMKKGYKIVVFAIGIFTVIMLIVSSISHVLYQNGKANPISEGVQFIFTPVQKTASKILIGIDSIVNKVMNTNTSEEENRMLKTEIKMLRQEVMSVEGLKRENENLRDLLEFKHETPDFDMVASEIIAKSDENRYIFKVDKGTDSGIKKDDIVVQRRMLVGRVTETGKNWAIVTSIISNKNSVGVRISRTQELALAENDFDLSRQCKMKLSFLPEKVSLVSGDTIETSGIGEIYPKGLLIGTVSEIKTDNTNNMDYAIIDMAVDFDQIQEVMIIRMKR